MRRNRPSIRSSSCIHEISIKMGSESLFVYKSLRRLNLFIEFSHHPLLLPCTTDIEVPWFQLNHSSFIYRNHSHTASCAGATSHDFVPAVRRWLSVMDFKFGYLLAGAFGMSTEIDSARRRLHNQTNFDMDHQVPPMKTVPLAPIWAMPGSRPTTTHEVARYGEPRQRSH